MEIRGSIRDSRTERRQVIGSWVFSAAGIRSRAHRRLWLLLRVAWDASVAAGRDVNHDGALMTRTIALMKWLLVHAKEIRRLIIGLVPRFRWWRSA